MLLMNSTREEAKLWDMMSPLVSISHAEKIENINIKNT